MGVSIRIDAQHFATQQLRGLWADASVAVTTSNPKVPTWTNAQTPAVVSTRTTKGLVRLKRLVLDVSNNICSVSHAAHVLTQSEAHYDITVTAFKVTFATVAVILIGC